VRRAESAKSGQSATEPPKRGALVRRSLAAEVADHRPEHLAQDLAVRPVRASLDLRLVPRERRRTSSSEASMPCAGERRPQRREDAGLQSMSVP
jgi:hypothetical protein